VLGTAFSTGEEAPGLFSARWRAADDLTVISMFPVRRDSANSTHASWSTSGMPAGTGAGAGLDEAVFFTAECNGTTICSLSAGLG
jgi:hypothetical protein